MINIPLRGYANSLLSLYHEGHLGYCQLSGIMNRTAVNTDSDIDCKHLHGHSRSSFAPGTSIDIISLAFTKKYKVAELCNCGD